MRPTYALGSRLLVLAVLMAPAARQARTDDASTAPVAWRAAAEAEGLAESDIEHLAREKLLIGVRSFPQIFSAYAGTQVPIFVTSDSVLRAYNVLLEESLGRVERARSRELPRVLLSIWDGLPTAIADPADLGVSDQVLAAAVRRAQITIGTALHLLGASTPRAPEEVREAIAEEVHLVRAGTARRRPPWLGASEDPVDRIDYDRFRPRGLYADDERLIRFYRAMAWLQEIPFHVQREEDLLTVAVLQNAFGRGWERDALTLSAHAACRRFMRRHTAFLGRRGDPTLYEHWGQSHLHGTKDQFLRDHPDLDDETRWDADVVVRVSPRIDLPDARLLETTFDARIRRGHPRPLPSGLDLASALGSTYAASWRRSTLGADGHVPTAWDELTQADDLYAAYLRTLSLLVDEGPSTAPRLFRSEAWARKSVNTVLAGWAQIRHAWSLAAMDSQKFFGSADLPAGWVEPEPEFFLRLLDVAIRTESFLRDARAFDPKVGRLDEAEDLEWFVDLVATLDAKGVLAGGYDAFRAALGPVEAQRYHRRIGARYYWQAASRIRKADAERDGPGWHDLGEHERQAAVLRMEATILREALEAFDAVREANPDGADDDGDPLALEARWEALQRILGRLSSLASKQLRNEPLDPDDDAFLRAYAKKLAYPMLYDGNAYRSPPPDRPLVASVFSAYPDPAGPRPGGAPRILHAGIGLPCALYVLWPHEGREVLCRGGVMPYREVVEASRLTDAQWRERLRADEPPPTPPWLQPISSAPRRAAE